jgi:hypothetical protein
MSPDNSHRRRIAKQRVNDNPAVVDNQLVVTRPWCAATRLLAPNLGDSRREAEGG